MPNPYIRSAHFDFLKDLHANNNREWFHAHKVRYQSQVRDPLLTFIADFGPLLSKISGEFRADPRPVGGSMFRIHRDVRFAKDKRPYKEFLGIQFRHRVGKDAHAPGFYFHLERDNIFAGAGMWHPDRPSLDKIRAAVAENQSGAWTRVKSSLSKVDLDLAGESLKRPPQGFDPEHPRIEDLKRKDFITTRKLTKKAVCGDDPLGVLEQVYRDAAPLVRFLTRALGLRW